MAEGLRGGILGEEEGSGPSNKAGTEAFAAAVATQVGTQNPEVAARTAAFLEEQAKLVKAQRKSVEAEHEYFEREWRPRLFGVRLRAAFQLFMALIATVIGTVGPAIADIQARLHDPEAAELALNTTREDPNDPTIGAMTHFVRGRLAFEAGNVSAAASAMEAFDTAYASPIVAANYPGFRCWIAPVEEAAGHPEKADAVLKSAGTHVDCYRFRAGILDGRGDWAAAQKAYAEAVALAPDLPAAYYSWGVALLKHGDLAGAAAKLSAANQRGPHWADPLKAWGDVLTKQNNAKEALAKYDEALRYAPNWKQLKEARETASASHAG